MVNKPLIRPYFLGGVALGGVARIPLTICFLVFLGWSSSKVFPGVNSEGFLPRKK